VKVERLARIVGLAVCLATVPVAGQEPRAKPPYRIGVLTAAWAPNHPSVEGLRAGLRALGLEEGRDVTLDIRFTEGNLAALPGVARALVNGKVDLVFTSAEPATQAAAAATTTIPVVFVNVGNPVAAGLVRDIAHPGGNVTGVSDLTTELTTKRAQILKEAVPGIGRVWAIYDVAGGAAPREAIRRLQDVAATLGVEILTRPISSPAELARTLRAVRPGDGFFVDERATALDIPAQILKASLAARAPVVFPSAFWLQFGALLTYGSDYHAVGYQAARLVLKILHGARPRDLPVEGANRIQLGVNLKTARALGVTIPQSVLMRADHVID
jgi:putative ABC transport system substrate-binding protein